MDDLVLEPSISQTISQYLLAPLGFLQYYASVRANLAIIRFEQEKYIIFRQIGPTTEF